MNKFKLVKLWGETAEEIAANYEYLRLHGYSIHHNCCVGEDVFLQCKILIGGEDGDILRGYDSEHKDATYEDFLNHEGEAIYFATPMHETEDGWFINSSDKCPIAHDVLIDARYRDGEELYDVPACASCKGWRETNEVWWQLEDNPCDIIAWRYPPTCKGSLSEKPVVIDKEEKHSHYKKDVRHLKFIDVYRVLDLYEVTNPCLQHAVKKLLVAGGRGAGKDIHTDIQEAIDSLERWKQMKEEDNQ